MQDSMNILFWQYSVPGGIYMGYQISYGPVKTKDSVKMRGKTVRTFALVICIIALVIGLQVSGVGKTLWRWMLPGDPEITGAALDTMVQGLKEGSSVGDAITVFCREIIENAHLLE